MLQNPAKLDFTKPLSLPRREIENTLRTEIPALVSQHRRVHDNPTYDRSTWKLDKENWSHLSKDQQELIGHVLTRFCVGMNCAAQILPTLEAASKKNTTSDLFQLIYKDMASDISFIISGCEAYLETVAGKELDPKAQTENFNKFFHQTLQDAQKAVDANQTGVGQLKAEVTLRTMYHVLGEGIGALSGIWGMNKALRELNQKESTKLPGLEKLLCQFTLIERRNIAFGLHEMGLQAKENYFLTLTTALKTVKEHRPTLEAMRNETFSRWEKFPFDIDQKFLANIAKKRVMGWVRLFIGSKPRFVARAKLKNLEKIL